MFECANATAAKRVENKKLVIEMVFMLDYYKLVRTTLSLAPVNRLVNERKGMC